MCLNKRLLVVISISALALTSCGAESGSTTTAAPTVDEGVATTTQAASDPGSTTTEPPPAPTTTVDSSSDGDQIQVVFEDGRTWTFNGTCSYTPDNTGPASALWSIDGEADDGSTFIAIMAFPFDPAKTTPVLIGNIVDAEENIFVLIESEDVSEGSKLILDLGLHDSVFKTVDDPIDLTATATCDL